jgi:hypothetical protein
MPKLKLKYSNGSTITINVPLFKKLRDNLGVKKVEAPSKCPSKRLIKLLSHKKKNYIPKFLKQRDIGNFMYPNAVVYCCCVLLSVVGCSCVLLCVRGVRRVSL